jgi:CheY-like chemotaxis protein
MDRSLERLNVLVVDDNHHMQNIVKTILRGFGIKELFDAANASDAFALVRVTAFDLIITDYAMEPVNGCELAKLIRTASDSPNHFVPIIMLTAYAERSKVEAAAEAVRCLRACGISVSLDDFGAGATSFGYLRALDVDGLKFDGSFLQAHEDNLRGVALMRSVARMCMELGIVSVGERVETETDRQRLLEAGVRYAQGYLFGAPARELAADEPDHRSRSHHHQRTRLARPVRTRPRARQMTVCRRFPPRTRALRRAFVHAGGEPPATPRWQAWVPPRVTACGPHRTF